MLSTGGRQTFFLGSRPFERRLRLGANLFETDKRSRTQGIDARIAACGNRCWCLCILSLLAQRTAKGEDASIDVETTPEIRSHSWLGQLNYLAGNALRPQRQG